MSEEDKKNQTSKEDKEDKENLEEKKEFEEVKEKKEEDKKDSSVFDFVDEEESEQEGKTEDEDLPEEIKKKLEKNKADKDKKVKGKKGVRKKKKKKVRSKVESGQVHIKATYNNTIVTFTDNKGEVISWASAGVAGFKGPKKSTPYAAQIITKIAIMKAKQEYGFKEASVFVRGVGMGRESAIRTLNAQGIFVNSIKDTTPIPHNGCRPRKPRRV